MSALPKIATGALATTALAWFLHGPIGLGENCAAQSRAATSASQPAASSANGTDDGFTTGEPATAETAAACQANVTRAASAGTINFATGGSGVAPQSSGLVDQIAAALRDCSGVSVAPATPTRRVTPAPTRRFRSSARRRSLPSW